MDERRKYIRIPEKSAISYNVVPTAILGQYATTDISQGGIRFLVHHFVPKDSHLKVKITFADTSVMIEALVKLVWIKELPYSGSYEVGVRFIDIPPKAADHLLKYIKSFVNKRSGMGRYSA
ncbi:MAG: PilZ domain-containing protein [Candidatus Omnitrophota bacterium]|nr:PilZ domain-containing protein [Candidatus Omnitrophota bacterium]